MQWLWQRITRAIKDEKGYGTVEMLLAATAIIAIGVAVSNDLRDILKMVNTVATKKITSLHGSGY